MKPYLTARPQGILRSLLLVAIVASAGSLLPAQDQETASDLVPEDTCIVDVTAPAEAMVVVDGHDYGEQRKLSFSPLTPGSTYQSELECRFANGQIEKRTFLIRGGHLERVSFRPSSKAQPKLALQAGHSMPAQLVKFHPNGKQVLTASGDGTAKIWDLATGHCLRSLTPHEAGVLSGAFSPDGRHLLLGSWHSTATLWDIAKGKRVQTFRGHEWKWHALPVALSPDGNLSLTGAWDNSVRLWDNQSGKVLRTFRGHESIVRAVAFSPDGRQVLTGSSDDSAILWDVATGRRLQAFSGHPHGIASAAFTPDGKQVLTNSGDPVILWDAATGRAVRTFRAHSDWVRDIAVSSNGSQLLTGSMDGTAILWDIATGRQVKTLRCGAGVASVAISPDGETAITGLMDRTSIVWNLSSGGKQRTIEGRDPPMGGATLSPKGRFLLTGGEEASLWDLKSGQQVRSYDLHEGRINSIAYSRDGQYVLTGSEDGTAILQNADDGQLVHSFKGHTGPVQWVALSGNGERAVTGSEDKTAIIWSLTTGKMLYRLPEHEKPVTFVAISQDGRQVMTAAGNTLVAFLWDADTGRLLHKFEGHTESLNTVAFNSTGRYAMTGACDRKAILWDLNTYRQVRTFSGYRHGVIFVDFCVDDRYVLVGSCDTTASLWEMQSGTRLQHFEGHDGCVVSATMAPDARHVVTCSVDGSTRIWDVATGRELARLTTVNNGKDWLVTTPEGLFDGSLAARERVFYQLGDTMSVFPVERFFQDFYYPGLLATIWRGERPIPDVEMGKQLPPKLLIVSHDVDDNTATIVAKATDEGGGIQGPWIYQNGTRVLASTDKQASDDSVIYTYHLDLVEGENQIAVKAACADGSWESEPAYVTLRYENLLAKPGLHVLAVGVNEYADDSLRLKYAATDAAAFAELFATRAPALFGGEENVHVHQVLNDQATKKGILAELDSIASKANPQDVFVMLLAGHGEMVGQRYYFLPHEFRRGENTDDAIREWGLPQDALDDAISRMPLKRAIIYDTCKSGGALGARSRSAVSFEKAMESSARAQGSYIISAATAGDEAQELDELGHGVLTYALLAAVGAVDTGPLARRAAKPSNAESGNLLAVREWYSYAEENVPSLTKLYFGREQFVVQKRHGKSFPLLPVDDTASP